MVYRPACLREAKDYRIALNRQGPGQPSEPMIWRKQSWAVLGVFALVVALWVIAFTGMRCDDRTKAYAARRRGEGLTRTEVLRCLKRYVAREVIALLRSSVALKDPDSAEHRLQLDT